MFYALIGILSILLLIVVLSPFYIGLGWFKWLYHDVLGWHKPNYDKGITVDFVNCFASCKHCGKEIMQDSQGNWFLTGGE